MAFPHLDRKKLKVLPLADRPNKVVLSRDAISIDHQPEPLCTEAQSVLAETVERIRKARKLNRPVILAFGAHTIKNGLAPILIRLMERGWLTHLATNGAGIIHDWEFSYQNQSSEDVRTNVAQGQFGIWQETGFYINLALIVGAYEGLGYGESVGKLIETEGLTLPSREHLEQEIRSSVATDPARAAPTADLLTAMVEHDLPSGPMPVPHPHKNNSVQAAAYRLNIPFTGHPMFGHDIIYCHPMNQGAAIGRTAERDFLTYARNVQDLDDGVYLSVGSAVMSPMIFEKSLSMAQNLHLQQGQPIQRHFIAVVDLAESTWNWQKDGEPPADDPAYYLRYCKTFNRMGGEMRYASADNRDFLVTLLHYLER